MFTGIITDVGTITSAQQRGDLRLTIGCGYDMAGVDLGASIACSGCCLTVVDKGADWFAVDVSGESLSKTASALWTQGHKLNLERARSKLVMNWAGTSLRAMLMVSAKSFQSHSKADHTAYQ